MLFRSNNTKSEVEEYNQLCNSMEEEVESLLRASQSLPSSSKGMLPGLQTSSLSKSISSPSPFCIGTDKKLSPRINVEEMYAKVRMTLDDSEKMENKTDLSREAFWREMDQSEESFQTIARFFAKGVIQ